MPHEWQALKQRAQAVFVREAVKARNLSLWEAFSAFDYDNSGVLSPSEFYGALVWLGVPDLTANDVADFIEAADTNRDGLVDYKEYMDYLSTGEEQQEENTTENDKQSNREAIVKVEPYGAEELREVLVQRKQAELSRQREERLHRQAYKDALDVKVFEEELEASKSRKGGANPAVTVVENCLCSVGKNIRVTDFKFSTNQNPLRLTSTGKSNFIPIFLDTAAQPPIATTKCPKKHALSSSPISRMSCTACRGLGACWSCTGGCIYHICQRCYGDRITKEQDRRDLAKTSTFLRCSNGCSFTMQVPTAGGGDDKTGQFSMTIELKLEKLPPAGHLQSLFRFSLPDLAQATRVHRTSVYINGDGIVVGKPITIGGGVPEGSKIRSGFWQTITVVVDPEAGALVTYINGVLCHTSNDLKASDLRLHHKFVVLGGGKQAHARGGDVRRVLIHGALLSPESVQALYIDLSNQHPFVGGRATRIQAIYRGYIVRKAYNLGNAPQRYDYT